MSKKYYLKPYILSYKQGKYLCLGNPTSSWYAEFEYSESLYKKIKNIIKNGIPELELYTDIVYKKLFEKDLLVDRRISTFNRNDLYLEYYIGKGLTEHEKSNHILIFGAGAGGSTLCFQLAQYGFNNISVVDFDSVSNTDLHKSFIYNASDVSMLKVESLQKRIFDNFGIKIKIDTTNISRQSHLTDYIKKVNPDIIVKACDPSLYFRKYLNIACFELKIPYIQMSYSFEFLNIGPLYVPGITGCDDSLNKMSIASYGNHYSSEQRFERLFEDYFVHPSTTTNISILSSIIVKELLFFISKNYSQCKSLGRRITFSAESFRFSTVNASCPSNCTICADKFKIKI